MRLSTARSVDADHRSLAREVVRTDLRVLVLVVLAVVLLLASCGDDAATTGDDTGGPAAVGALPSVDTEYWSTSITDDGVPHELVPDTRISLHVTASTIGASLGCNSIGGEYQAVDGRLQVGSLSMTEMGCDPARHDQDEWFATFLGENPTYGVDGATLVLQAGTTRIEFVERSTVDPARPLAGTAWTVDGFFDRETAMSFGIDVAGTIRFDEATSTATGFDGCNDFSVAYEVDGGDLRFGPVDKGTASCPEAEDYQERFHVVLFSEQVSWAVAYDHLTLTAADGRGVTFLAGD